MIRRLRRVFRSASDKNPTVICLNRAESDRDHEVNIENFSLLPLMVHIVEGHDFLIELEEVDLVGSGSVDA